MKKNFLAVALSVGIPFFMSSCLIFPASRGSDKGKCSREKELNYGSAPIIIALNAVLEKQGFTITSSNPTQGFLSAKKTGLITSDYGYTRFQKYCLFWGYGAYGTLLVDARVTSEGARKSHLCLNSAPISGNVLDKTLEELELKLFLDDKTQ